MLLISIVMVIVTAVALPTQYIITKNKITAEFVELQASIENDLKVILQEPIYAYDKPLVQAIIDAYAQKSEISTIRVSDQNRKILAEVKLRTSEFSVSNEIVWDKLPIGSIEIGFNQNAMRAELTNMTQTSSFIILTMIKGLIYQLFI